MFKSLLPFLFILLIVFQFSSCVPEEDISESDFEIPLKWQAVQGSSDWDVYLRNAINDYGSELLDATPSDITRFAPNYLAMNDEERLNFWAYLISIMSERESSFNPDTFFVEAFNDASGNNVVSRGLLQLSIESARGYSCPFLNSAQDLHDPENNLICSVLIMKRWVLSDGVISGKTSAGSWRGGARYWSVLRKEDTLKFFTNNTVQLF